MTLAGAWPAARPIVRGLVGSAIGFGVGVGIAALGRALAGDDAWSLELSFVAGRYSGALAI